MTTETPRINFNLDNRNRIAIRSPIPQRPREFRRLRANGPSRVLMSANTEIIFSNTTSPFPIISPRGLSRTQAAAYVGLSPSGFGAARREGKYPNATLPGGRYDRTLLDRAMDKVSRHPPQLKREHLVVARPAIIPAGSWPRRMNAELAAAYCGEPTVDAFIKRVGKEYPNPPHLRRAPPPMAKRRSGRRDPPVGIGPCRRRGRGLVMFTLPRYVRPRVLAGGQVAFYWIIPTYFRRLGCTIPNEPLGTDYTVACGEDGRGGRAATLNALFDEWDLRGGVSQSSGSEPQSMAQVDWLFQEYKKSKAYTEKVSSRSRPDYERTIHLVSDLMTKKGDRLGRRQIKSITPVSADKIYEIIIAGPRGERLRQGEKVVALCRRAWRVVHRLHPGEFNRGESKSMGGRYPEAPNKEKEARSYPRTGI